MAQENISAQLNDLLASRDFQAELLDKEGRPTDAENADIFTFDYVSSGGKNYGTMVIILDADNEMQVFYGDNLGRSMEGDDKTEFFDFVQHLHKFANMRRWTYSPKNINQVKYTMQGLAAIKEGLFEGYYGTRKVSYSGEPTEARLVIQHNRTLGEADARFRYVESLFIETADSERYRLQFKNLAGGRAMLEHVRQGGKPYDVRGCHITEMVAEIATLSRFNRASAGRVLEGVTAELVTEAQQYYKSLRENLKRMAGTRGYQAYFESWHPAEATLQEELVDSIKTMFVEQTLDSRIEAALPVLARLQQENRMKEADIFESWADNLSEGTWALPDTPEKHQRLQDLMSRPLIVGPDATNATEQLDDLVGDDRLFDYLEDLAARDASANVWDDTDVQLRLGDLGIQLPGQPPEDDEDDADVDATADADQQPPVQESRVKELSMDLEDPLMSDEEFETKYGDSRANMQGRAGRVQDRKTGKFYDPEQEFDRLKNSPEFGAQMRRMAQREGMAEGWLETTGAGFLAGLYSGHPILGTVLGAALGLFYDVYKNQSRKVYQVFVNGQPIGRNNLNTPEAIETIVKMAEKEHNTITQYSIVDTEKEKIVFRKIWGGEDWKDTWHESIEQGVAEDAKKDMSKEVKAMATGTCPHCKGPVKKKEFSTLTQYHCPACGIRASQDKSGVTEGDVFRRHGKNRNPTIDELEMWIKNWTGHQIGGNLTDAGRAKVGQSIAKAQRLLAKKKQQQGVTETSVSKYADMGANDNTTHFIKNITTGKIVSPHRSLQDAQDALVGNERGSNDKFRIVRARKSSVAEGQDVESVRDRIESLKRDLKAVTGSYPGDARNRDLIRSEIFRAKEELKAARSKKPGVAEGSEYKSRHAHKQEQDKAYNDYRTKHATSSVALMTRAEFAKDQRERAAKKKQGVAEAALKGTAEEYAARAQAAEAKYLKYEDLVDQELQKLGQRLPQSWDAAKMNTKLSSHPKYALALKYYTLSEKFASQAIRYEQLARKQGMTESIPDVDHMSGPRGINLPVADTRDLLSRSWETYGNYEKWARDVDRVNSELLDDNAEFTTSAGGEIVSINNKRFAAWSKRNGNGDLDIALAKKYGQQGVAEGRATYGPITDAHKAASKKAFAAGERDGKAGAEKNKQYMSSALMKTTYLNGYKQGKQGKQGVAKGYPGYAERGKELDAATKKIQSNLDKRIAKLEKQGVAEGSEEDFENWKKTVAPKAAQSAIQNAVKVRAQKQALAKAITQNDINRALKQKGVAEGWDDEDEVDKITLIKSLQWPELVNKVNSAMKAMGWKGQRKDDGSFMFSTRGQLDDEWYIVVIDNRGNKMFTYALGTVEEGDPHIGEQESLPMTEASVSELMNAIREGFGLGEASVSEVSKATIDRYVTKASDAHGDADFKARMSKNDLDKRSYHVDQKKTAEKRRQGISRALDRMSREESVEEATSVAVRMQRAADKQRAKSDASLARTPSSIPKKEEPKKQGVSERVRDPEDWDEGNTEPPNNFAVYINGKKWKVFKGRGYNADDYREKQHYQQLKVWADKKSAETGKKWTVSITGEEPTA